eukprot:15367052-Ditylum_brightwellii.AAC.1
MSLVNTADMRAVVEYQGTTTQAFQSIMKCIVTEKSEEKYTNKNITLMLWLYKNKSLCKELL